MKYSWQLNIFGIVLLISLCSGGPVAPTLNKTLSDSEDSSKNNDLSLVSKTVGGTTAGINKLPADTTKLYEANAQSVQLAVGSTKSSTNISSKANIISNYNVKINNTATSVKDNASSPVAEIIPSAINLVVTPSSETSAAEQVKSEGDNQKVVVKENVTKATNNEGTPTDKAEMENKVEGSKITILANGSNTNTKDEKDSSGITVEDKKDQSNVNDSQDLPNLDKLSETVLKVSTNKPDLPEKNEVTGTDPEQSADSPSNTKTVKDEPTADSESNTQTENQESMADLVSNTQTDKQETIADSESNMQTDNQESSADLLSNTQTENQGTSADSESNKLTDNQDPSADVSNKIPADVSVSKSTPTTTSSSSFDIYIGDSSATYPHSGDQDFSSFNGYNGNDNDASYDDEVGMNSVDNAPYDNERGAYKNEQQKLNGEFTDDTDSHFFAYFLTIMVSAIVLYLLFHNKQRIIALIIEGRSSPRSRRGSGRTRYHKLDTNLEEAMVQTKGSTRFDGLY